MLDIHISFRRRAEQRASDFERRISAIADSVAGRFARGNVTLQQGLVVTREQLDKEREELRAYSATR